MTFDNTFTAAHAMGGTISDPRLTGLRWLQKPDGTKVLQAGWRGLDGRPQAEIRWIDVPVVTIE